MAPDIGAMNRIVEAPERELATHYAITAGRDLWLPLYAPVRKTERFKTYIRNTGLVDYWKARSWPDLCRPVTPDDFVCD